MRKRSHLVGLGCLAVAIFLLGLCGCSSPRGTEGGKPASLEAAELACEWQAEPLGLDVVQPRLAWKLRARDPAERGQRQSAYHVLVATERGALARNVGDLWDSGVVQSDRTVGIEYAGEPLRSTQHAWWKVRARDRGGRWSRWSSVAHWCTGPLMPSDWGARWIGAAGVERALHLDGARWITGGDPSKASGRQVLRRGFRIEGEREVVAAELLVCSAERLEVWLDGARLETIPGGPEPVVLELTRRLVPGAHALAFRAGEHGCLARLRVFFREGTDSRLATDESWRASSFEERGWTDAGFDDARWSSAEPAPAPGHEYEDALRDTGPLPDPWLRKSFELEDEVVRATAWVASLGYHELHANGAKVGEAVLAPGVSDLSQRVRWVAYDLTGHLERGRNALGLWLSAGWARFERFGVARAPLVLLRADVELANGRTFRVVSDGSWRARASPSTHLGGWGFADFGGERWDARADEPDWCAAQLDDAGWERALERDLEVTLSARRSEPDREIEALAPIAIEELGPGVFRIDMGRSTTGFFEARLIGAPGATVTLTWSERAEEETTYAQRSECVLDAHGRATFRNRFDYAAGRWITLRGPIEAPRAVDVSGWLVRSGYARAAEFECSDPLLQRIHDTIVWTFECLSQGGILADCPHRERLGYGGDAHATLGTGLTHFALARFYSDWLEDWRDVQGRDGGLPYTAPTCGGGGGPSWSGIVAYLPWELYVATGARRVLEESYPTAKRWLEFIDARMQDGLLQPYGDPLWGFLGDWVPPGRGQSPGERVDERSTLFFNNAYLVLCLDRMARAATVLGLDGEVRDWRRRADELRDTLHARFYDAERASYTNGEQPYLALALLARIVPADPRPAVLARLEHEIRVVNQGHVDSGIHGTAFLLRALAEEERHDLVLELARQTTYPGWGHMLEEGATTIWEQWDGVHSRLHSSFLSLGEWFVQGVAGIRPDPERPGYEHVIVRPAPVGDLTSARARFDSVRGPIEVEWERAGERFTLRVSVPPGSTATIHVPTDEVDAVLEGGRPATEAAGVSTRRGPAGTAAFEVESGRYEFSAPLGARGR